MISLRVDYKKFELFKYMTVLSRKKKKLHWMELFFRNSMEKEMKMFPSAKMCVERSFFKK